MTTAETMTGKCLCGTVSVTVGKNRNVEACHCGMCRRWGGGPLLAIHCGPDVLIGGSENIGVFSSSDWAERAFCKTCGTHLYYRLKPANEYIMTAGLFQDQEDFTLKDQIFIDRKPAYYAFANQTPVLTEAEVFAKFAGM